MELDARILQLLVDADHVNSLTLAQSIGVDHQAIVGAAKSLESGGYVVSTVKAVPRWTVSEEGHAVAKHGSPEFRLWTLLADGPMEQSKAVTALGGDVFSIALANGMKAKWFSIQKDNGQAWLQRGACKPSSDAICDALGALLKGEAIDPRIADALQKRKLASLENIKALTIERGPQYQSARRSAPAELTRALVQSGEWTTTTFRRYNIDAHGKVPVGGTLHPLMRMREAFCEVFVSLGFQEMPTQQWVECSFWNFDALFVPQQHPARDAQDTFFVSNPEFAEAAPDAYVEKVRDIHEAGYRCRWDERESRRNVLRTHTTAVSSWILYHLAQHASSDGGCFKPGRYFSIDRVFRNEDVDRTHLCEFHQVEGFVVDKGLSLAHMISMLEQFFLRIGVKRLRFKPTYNPYTEPSMEVFGYHEGLARWIEVGNSGLFRPEMLRPMGFDEDVSAIAWGLSLERPTMMAYGLNSIHQLFGHHVDLRLTREVPFVVF